MCSAVCMSTIILIPTLTLTLIVSSIFWTFSTRGQNEAVIAIKNCVNSTAAKTEEARNLLKDLTELEFPEKCDTNKNCTTAQFDQSVSAAIDSGMETIIDAVSKLFSWNFFGVLGLLFDTGFQERVKTVGLEIFELVKIKSQGEFQAIVEQQKGKIPDMIYVLEAKMFKRVQPIVELLQPQTQLVLKEVSERGNDPAFLERFVTSGVSAEDVWKHLFAGFNDDKTAVAQALNASFHELDCDKLKVGILAIAEPLLSDLSMLARSFERLGGYSANETLAKYNGDFDLAYAAVENQTSSATTRTLNLIKTYVDIHNKTLISEQEYATLLKTLSEPAAFVIEVRDAVKEVSTLAMAAKEIQRMQLKSMEVEAAKLDVDMEELRAKERNEEREGQDARDTTCSSIPPSLPKSEPEDKGTGDLVTNPDSQPQEPAKEPKELQVLRLRSRLREVENRSVCDMIKGHAVTMFPGLQNHS